MTSVQSPLPHNTNGYTALLGYDSDRNVFAGYDLARHTTFTSGSPSVQVNVSTLNQALQSGLAFETKSNDEIVVGVRSDLLFFYIQFAHELHRLGSDSTTLDVVQRVSTQLDVSDTEVSELPVERHRIVQETSRWSRSTSFRRQVLNAYEHRCAVTRQQLKLVEAAHILPVKAGNESIDVVGNGNLRFRLHITELSTEV